MRFHCQAIGGCGAAGSRQAPMFGITLRNPFAWRSHSHAARIQGPVRTLFARLETGNQNKATQKLRSPTAFRAPLFGFADLKPAEGRLQKLGVAELFCQIPRYKFLTFSGRNGKPPLNTKSLKKLRGWLGATKSNICCFQNM